MLNLKEFSIKNESRSTKGFMNGKQVPLTYWTTALSGELGELCNMIKKMERVRIGGIDGGSSYNAQSITKEMLAEEIGGIAIYLDLIATHLGISLEESIIKTFNDKSDKHNFSEYLSHQ